MVPKQYCCRLFLLTLLALVGWQNAALAQDAPVLGDEAILFVNGPNVLIPSVAAEVVNDPLDPGSGNLVAKFNNGSWADPGLTWDRKVGIDMTANVNGESETAKSELHFKILVDPANVGKNNLWITIFDATTDPTASRADAEAALPAEFDYRARLNWTIPGWMRNGEWHDVALKLPAPTIAEHDSNRVDKNLDGSPIDVPLDSLSKIWQYGGGWATFGVACCGSAFDNTQTEDPLWREFEWDAVQSIAIHFDFDEGAAAGPGGPVYLDDIFIGDDDTDLSAAADPPSALDNLSAAADGPLNVLSWTGSSEFGGYNVFASEEAILDVDSDNVVMLGSLAFDAGDGDAFTYTHNYQLAHPSLAGSELFYAVTSKSQFGVENKNVGASSTSLGNPAQVSQAWIPMLTEDQADMLFTSIENGIASGEGFPEGMIPFEIEECSTEFTGIGPCPGGERISWTDGGGAPVNAADNSGKFWIGISADNELFVYGEIMDDIIEPGLESENGGLAWNRDSVEGTIGTYGVSSALLGSDHQGMDRGEFPDHQLRFSFHEVAGQDDYRTETWESNSLTTDGAAGGNVPGGVTVYGVLDDANGKATGSAGAVIGWKMLALVPLAQIVGAESGDAIFEPPADDEIKLIPFSIAINDGDGAGRESQINWSIKGNVSNQWWNTPAQWPVVAVAGTAVSTASEGVDELPSEFSLEQNYPNPFNPSTAIRFSIPNAEKVTLTVYNVLGHRVATLISGEQMSAGQHNVSFDASNLASGAYMYRLEAGAEFVQTRRMLLVK